jgi:metal-responsive CopG/Arc/MetJ family transcriptional regulator
MLRMNPPTLSPRQLAALTSLVTAPARKAKASVTLSGNLLRVIDALAGSSQRSAWIERALRSYARRELKQQRRARELELLNRHAKTLNDDGADSAAYQSSWDTE